MSERYGACRDCIGSGNYKCNPDLECGACNGTGFGGSIDDLLDPLRIPRRRVMEKPEKGAHAYEVAIQTFISHCESRTKK